jgi:predicted lipoprotein
VDNSGDNSVATVDYLGLIVTHLALLKDKHVENVINKTITPEFVAAAYHRQGNLQY